ncbi:TIGR03862 family flavoprotein [Nitrincola tapanii]|uniref:TIGR03862 family flavoprotein n=2 Tax=Nitrincola tapanii TaxID=1708751 RepID=A0A5A9W412_9GAMM|nr:TIGR03862 family flavoprotein [Nitrincola tapanii]
MNPQHTLPPTDDSPTPTTSARPERIEVAIIGGGPAGLMAAEVLLEAGRQVHLFDAMPTLGRKFLMAGRGGLNLTHSEDAHSFQKRFYEQSDTLAPMLKTFTADDIRAWTQALGIETFIGSSGRIFPTEMKAAPLLRAWLSRLKQLGLVVHTRHRWLGKDLNTHCLHFLTPDGSRTYQAQTTLLALGGGSWAKLGSDGAWVDWLKHLGCKISTLRPCNGGFEYQWSEFILRHAGTPLKNICLSFHTADGHLWQKRGELMLTESGLEGSLIYAASTPLRRGLEAQGEMPIHLDLTPDRTPDDWMARLSRPRGKRSLSKHLQNCGLSRLQIDLLRERLRPEQLDNPTELIHTLKHYPVRILATRPIDEAISTAGGLCFSELNPQLMLKRCPGVFCAGEMLDWEAPTGGYLLTACFATGRWAAQGMLDYLASSEDQPSLTTT